MAMGTGYTEQAPLWVAASDLPVSPGHPFYTRLNALLDAHAFDAFVEDACRGFYAPVLGRPSLAPGRYFRLLLIGYFEGIDSERGIAWRRFVGSAELSAPGLEDAAPPLHDLADPTPDRSGDASGGVHVGAQRLVTAGLLKGWTIEVDATTLEANAAMRSIVRRRDTGEDYIRPI
jgi:transposase